MLTPAEIAAIHTAVRAAGNQFLPDFRRLPVPQTMAELQVRLADIEARCLAALASPLAATYPDTRRAAQPRRSTGLAQAQR